MIEVPQWPCEKCGQVPLTRLHEEFTFASRMAYRDAAMGGSLWSGYYDGDKPLPSSDRLSCGVEEEHLHHTCGRCGHTWTTATLDRSEVAA